MKYSKDGRVCFNAENHTYKLGDKYLQGVTGLIEKFKNPFNSDEVATKYAAKHGLDKDELLADWAAKGLKSRNDGTIVHKMIEEYILTGELSIPGVSKKESAAVLFIEEYFKSGKLVPVEAEMIVHNDHVATQIDVVAKNRLGEYFILDWKTNSTISDNGYGKKMLPPFGRYPDATFYHYSLQLNFCKSLCREYPIKDAFIVHLKDEGFEIMNIENMTIPENVLLNKINHGKHTSNVQ